MNDIEKQEKALFKESRGERQIRLKAEDRAYLNTQMTRSLLRVSTLPKIDINDPKAIYDRAMQYFTICQEEGLKPTQEGIANALKISRFTFSAWLTGKVEKPKEIREVINWIHSTIETMTVQSLAEGEIHPITGIFLLKNNFGYTNDERVVVQKDNEEKVDIEAIRNKYKELEG